ncbi:MAG: DUF3103 family protein [Cyclobacteriaceae bacterium]
MKKVYCALALGAMLVSFGCQKEELITPQPSTESAMPGTEAMAVEVSALLDEENPRQNLLNILKEHPQGMKMTSLFEQSGLDNDLNGRLRSLLEQNTQVSGKQIRIPEMWLHEPEGLYNSDDLLIAFPPKGDEKDWVNVKAYTLDNKVVYLDAMETPDVPVLVVETYGYQAFEREVELMNQELQRQGLQSPGTTDYRKKNEIAQSSGLETTKLTNIRLNDDQEPWVSGSAEIYAITSGIRNSSNEAEVAVIPMYYLDKDGTTYYPNQIMLFWDDYAYQAANIQLYEKDGGHNYQDMVSILVSGIADIAGTLSGQYWVNALGKIASAIVEVVPSSFWTNDDDYVDSFYTIEKNRYYTNYYGAGANARVSLVPYVIAAN